MVYHRVFCLVGGYVGFNGNGEVVMIKVICKCGETLIGVCSKGGICGSHSVHTCVECGACYHVYEEPKGEL